MSSTTRATGQPDNATLQSGGTGGLELAIAYTGQMSGFGGNSDQFIDFTHINSAGATVSYKSSSSNSGVLTVTNRLSRMRARSVQAATLMYALTVASLIHIHCGNYATANAVVDELIALADEKGTTLWKAYGMVHQGCVLAQTGIASDAVQMITASLIGSRSTGSTLWTPYFLSYLARAYADSASSMTLGAALVKRGPRWTQTGKGGSRPKAVVNASLRAQPRRFGNSFVASSGGRHDPTHTSERSQLVGRLEFRLHHR